MFVKNIGDVVDIWDQAAPDKAAVFRRHTVGNDAIKFRSEEIGIFMPSEEFLEDIFLVSVEYKLFFADIPENLIVKEYAQTHSRI